MKSLFTSIKAPLAHHLLVTGAIVEADGLFTHESFPYKALKIIDFIFKKHSLNYCKAH